METEGAGKRQPRLGVWLRVLIVVTLAWLIAISAAAYFWARYETYHDIDERYRSCTDRAEMLETEIDTPEREAICMRISRLQEAGELRGDDGYRLRESLWTAFVSLPLAWLLIVVVVGASRWILAGRRRA